MQSWDDRLPWYTGYIYLIIFYVIFHICWRRSVYTCRHSSFVFYTPSTSSHTGAPDTIIIIHTEAVLKSISFYNKLFLAFWSSLTSCTSVLIFASHLVFVLFFFFASACFDAIGPLGQVSSRWRGKWTPVMHVPGTSPGRSPLMGSLSQAAPTQALHVPPSLAALHNS